MTTLANCWQIKYVDRDRLILQHVDHPGYIAIDAFVEHFTVGVFPDVGNEPDAALQSEYKDLETI